MAGDTLFPDDDGPQDGEGRTRRMFCSAAKPGSPGITCFRTIGHEYSHQSMGGIIWPNDHDAREDRIGHGEPGPVRHHAPATSHDAAAQAAPITGPQRVKIFRLVKDRGTQGATCDECEVALKMSHQSCSAAINALKKPDNRILHDSGRTRLTRGQRPAIVWVTEEHRNHGQL